MQTQTETTEPRTVADAPPTCDRDCEEPATQAYAWEWGEKGVCCATHQFLLQQVSTQLSRSIGFSPLQPAAPAPLTRDERARLKGENYALEMEIEDLKSRGMALYNENTILARQAQAAVTRGRETSLQLEEAKATIDQLTRKLEQRDAEQADLVDECSRLRTLAKFSEPHE
jgi:hypothetical protein